MTATFPSRDVIALQRRTFLCGLFADVTKIVHIKKSFLLKNLSVVFGLND